jgi:hypothetical protein
MQIINVGSDRGNCYNEHSFLYVFKVTLIDLDCEYEMSVYYNGKEQISQRGTLHKVDKSMTADRPQEEAMRL